VGPGDRIGVAALSGPVDPERLEAGLAALRHLGFEPVLADNVLSRQGLFAGGDAERLDGFHRLAADPGVRAILFARGGHGVLRVLPAIDWDLLRRVPRAYVGYSDLTPFLLAVVARLGWVSFHGPLVAADLARGLSAEEEGSFLAALSGARPLELPWRSCPRPSPPSRNGAARGPVLGGCLSLLAATVGTPFLPDLEGALLVWEDLNEAPYRVDRMLTHLGLSGNLANITGMVVGHVGPLPDPLSGAGADDSEFASVTLDSTGAFGWPVAWGAPVGHVAPNRTVPLGAWGRFDEAGSRLVIGE
jgi:muramoyltetrapeptide carboxypeptidase